MEICPHHKCTGCFACVSICPKQCISMLEDEYGELHPHVEESSCIQCGACKSTCPNNQKLEYHEPLKVYATWNINKEERMICASAGVGTLMSRYVIEFRKGIVLGSKYDKDFNVVTSQADTVGGIMSFRGSKYAQSIVGGVILDMSNNS